MNHSAKQTILVLGASGLLGNAVLRVLAQSPALNVVGTLRSDARSLRMVDDYATNNVFEKVLRIIMSYPDYVNRVVWHRSA